MCSAVDCAHLDLFARWQRLLAEIPSTRRPSRTLFGLLDELQALYASELRHALAAFERDRPTLRTAGRLRPRRPGDGLAEVRALDDWHLQTVAAARTAFYLGVRLGERASVVAAAGTGGRVGRRLSGFRDHRRPRRRAVTRAASVRRPIPDHHRRAVDGGRGAADRLVGRRHGLLGPGGALQRFRRRTVRSIRSSMPKASACSAACCRSRTPVVGCGWAIMIGSPCWPTGSPRGDACCCPTASGSTSTMQGRLSIRRPGPSIALPEGTVVSPAARSWPSTGSGRVASLDQQSAERFLHATTSRSWKGAKCTFAVRVDEADAVYLRHRVVGLPDDLALRRLPGTTVWFTGPGDSRRIPGSSTSSNAATAITGSGSTIPATRSWRAARSGTHPSCTAPAIRRRTGPGFDPDARPGELIETRDPQRGPAADQSGQCLSAGPVQRAGRAIRCWSSTTAATSWSTPR